MTGPDLARPESFHDDGDGMGGRVPLDRHGVPSLRAWAEQSVRVWDSAGEALAAGRRRDPEWLARWRPVAAPLGPGVAALNGETA